MADEARQRMSPPVWAKGQQPPPQEKGIPFRHTRNQARLLLADATREELIAAMTDVISKNPALALDALAAATDPDRKPEPGWQALGRERSDLISHLHGHPNHAGRYPAGHDFMLVSTADIRRQHERLHAERPTGHEH